MNHGKFVISLDFELMWGVRDVKTIANYGNNVAGVHQVIPGLLKMFSEFEPEFYLGGDNVMFWGPLSWTMIYGLIVATFLTLLVVPTMYMLGYKTRAWFRRKTTA